MLNVGMVSSGVVVFGVFVLFGVVWVGLGLCFYLWV